MPRRSSTPTTTQRRSVANNSGTASPDDSRANSYGRFSSVRSDMVIHQIRDNLPPPTGIATTSIVEHLLLTSKGGPSSTAQAPLLTHTQLPAPHASSKGAKSERRSFFLIQASMILTVHGRPRPAANTYANATSSDLFASL
jgi:hypothetical protein